MKAAGIIAEYDPFHNGHLYHLNKTKELTGADAAVVVMSGYFMQRGEPSFFDREARVRMAVEAGADLVLELPYIYACNSSHEFAAGAVGILDGLGCIDSLVFGAETGDMALLKRAADASSECMPGGVLSAHIKEELKKGISYAEALTRTVEKQYGSATSDALRHPNNLLGIEYIKALNAMSSAIRPLALPRLSAGHDEPLDISDAAAQRRCMDTDMTAIASGTAVRRAVRAGGYASASGLVPESSLDILRQLSMENHYDEELCQAPLERGSLAVRWDSMQERLFELLRYRILTSEEYELASICGFGEGIENRLKGCILQTSSLEELKAAVKTRRYTHARISRLLIHILINLKTEDFRRLRGVYHARVLGFSRTGSRLLREISDSAVIPVLSNLSRAGRLPEAAEEVLRYDMRASDVYAMLTGSNAPADRERRYIPYRSSR